MEIPKATESPTIEIETMVRFYAVGSIERRGRKLGSMAAASKGTGVGG